MPNTTMHWLLDAERHALSKIAAGVSLTEVLNELLRAVELRSEGEMLASVLFLDKYSPRLLHGAAPSLPAAYNEAIHGIEIGPSVGSCGTAAFHGRPVYVADIASDPLWAHYRDFALAHGLCACWSTPIRGADERVLGTFAVYYREPRAPMERDLESIALISRTVALAIERYWLQEALRESQDRLHSTLSVNTADRKQSEDALRRQVRRLEALDRFSKSISIDLDLERIVQTVTDIATELSGARFGAFFYKVFDESGEQYILYTLSGAPREAFARFGLPRKTALFEPTFHGAGAVCAGDVRTDPRYGKNAPHYGMPKGHLPVVSYLAVPVKSRSGDVHGGLFFGHDEPDIFTQESVEMVTTIALHAANAIDNARRLQAVQAELAERRRMEETYRREAELALRESEARLQEALAAGQVMAFEWNPVTGTSYRSANAAQILGLTGEAEEGLSARQFLLGVHPDDRARFKAHVFGVSPGKPAFSIGFRFVRPDGREIWLEERARAEFDAAGNYVRLKGLTRDITGRMRSEERQRLLVAELDHRVKNVLACVTVVAQRTRERRRSMDEFLEVLDGRIRSMANAHALLSRGRWRGAYLGDILREELASWEAEHSVSVEGPEVFLEVGTTQALATVLHELTTNAAKYGALSTRDGRIRVRWQQRRSKDASSPRLLFEWRESGGPPVVPPSRHGYGTSVIRDLIPYELGGSVDLEFRGDGVICRIELPGGWREPAREVLCNNGGFVGAK